MDQRGPRALRPVSPGAAGQARRGVDLEVRPNQRPEPPREPIVSTGTDPSAMSPSRSSGARRHRSFVEELRARADEAPTPDKDPWEALLRTLKGRVGRDGIE